MPGQRRPGGRSAGWPTGHRGVADAVPRLRLGAGVMGASSTGAQAYREAGLSALQLGDEAILYPDRFKLSGADMKGSGKP